MLFLNLFLCSGKIHNDRHSETEILYCSSIDRYARTVASYSVAVELVDTQELLGSYSGFAFWLLSLLDGRLCVSQRV